MIGQGDVGMLSKEEEIQDREKKDEEEAKEEECVKKKGYGGLGHPCSLLDSWLLHRRWTYGRPLAASEKMKLELMLGMLYVYDKKRGSLAACCSILTPRGILVCEL